jgi:putative ABC transport system substrate-binding protein
VSTRRAFITLLGGAAAAWPLAARAQKRGAAVVGFLLPGSPADSSHYATAFLQGLRETGYVEGQSVTIEYRWAEGRYERLSQFASELVNRGVAVIAAGGPPSVAAAKSATSAIPIVFIVGDDPVKDGLVASFNRPRGNLTGVTMFAAAAMWGKRLELLRELIPKASSVSILINPNDALNPDTNEIMLAARALGMRLSFTTAATDSEIETAFSMAAERRINGLLVSDRPFFTVRHEHIVALAAHYAVPAVYGWREYAAAGGLISYGNSLIEALHQVGVYTGKILNGEKPADLPVVQPTKFELVINLKTARALNLAVPLTLQASADEVIE